MPTPVGETEDNRARSAVLGSPGTDRFLRAFAAAADGGEIGLYLVGSPGLGDLSPRQSNLDLVAVSAVPLPAERLRDLAAVHRSLRRNGRDAVVAYTTWESLRQPVQEAEARVYLGPRQVDAEVLVNPMTWAILAEHPCVVAGDRRPTVRCDREVVRAWFRDQLPSIVERTERLLWRRHLARVVLESTRAAHGALTGEVVSLRRAGEVALETASHTGRRLLTDALGYREGASTSMYWGPFERRSNAATLGEEWRRRVGPGLIGGRPG